MRTKPMIYSCFFLGLGFVLHSIVPGIGGMKPDFLLTMMIAAIFLDRTLVGALSIGFLAGILSALTTVFPGGQILSIMDKLGSAIAVYLVIKGASRVSSSLGIITIIGTLVSGLIFLSLAASIMKMGSEVILLFFIVVIPTVILNFLINVYLIKPVLCRLKVVAVKN